MNHESTCPYFTFSTRGTTVHYELYEHENKTERPTFVLVHGFFIFLIQLPPSNSFIIERRNSHCS